jgi:hypothetical protein
MENDESISSFRAQFCTGTSHQNFGDFSRSDHDFAHPMN